MAPSRDDSVSKSHYSEGACVHRPRSFVLPSNFGTTEINLTDALVTIDAMGCQKEIARDIVAGGGDFVIAVKDNQPTLRQAVETYFAKHLEHDLVDLKYRSHETSEAAHGRIEERSYFL